MSALVEIGELPRARGLCEKLLSFASPLQLYAEEIDPHTGRHLGNFPQAFTHLALINAVMHVIRAEAAITGATSGARAAGQPSESNLAGSELIGRGVKQITPTVSGREAERSARSCHDRYRCRSLGRRS